MPNRKPSLRLELLENRDNPAAVTWDGGASTLNWADPANWSTNTLPTPSDDVTIDIIGTTATINFNLTAMVKSLVCAENLTVVGGTLTINEASAISGLLNHAQGTLQLAGPLTTTGGFNWSNGTLRGTGKLVLAEGTTNSIGAAGNNQTLGTTIENRGTLSVTNPNGYFVYFGASNSEPGTLDNYGTLTVTNDGDFSYSGYSGAQKIVNRGTLNRTGIGTSTIRESVQFDNLGGTISVQGGIFEAGGGGTLDGMTISQGIFDIGNGSFTLPAGSAIGGPGTFRMKAGIGTGNAEIVAGANAQIVNFDQVAGSLGVVGTLTVTGSFNWSNGTLRGTGKLVLAEGTTNSIGATSNNQTLGATIENRGALSVVNPNGYFVYFGASNSEPGTLDNYGTLTVTNDGDFNYTGTLGTQKIINRGILNRTGIGTSTIRESVTFDNLGGTISVQGGIFEAGGGGTLDGMTITEGIFDIGNGSFTIPANAVIGGPGTLRMKAGIGTGVAEIVAGANAQVVNFAQVAGTLSLTNTLTITGGFNWSNGTLRGAGKLVLAEGTTNSIGATSNNQTLGTTIENRGALSMVNPNGYFVYFGASNSEPGTLDNYGTLTVTNDGDFSYSGYTGMQKIINRGTLNRTGIGTSTVRESVLFDNLSGTISVQGGIFEAGGGGTINGMTIAQGIFDIGNGSFTLPADSMISGPGTFRMKAGIGTGNAEIIAGANARIVNFDQVAGSLSLTSTLTVTGGFNWSNGTLRGSGKLLLEEGTTNSIGATSNNQMLGTTIENRGALSVINPNGYFVYFGASNSEPGLLDNYGTLTVTNDGDFSYSGYTGAQKIVNRGTIIRTGVGTSTVRESVLFDNLGGTISVQGGIFEAGGGGTLDGMTIADGIFDIGNGSFTIPANAVISGPGTFRMKAGIGTGTAEIVAGANAQIVNLTQVAGSLSLANTLTVTGGFNWSNGTLRGTGKLVLAEGTTNNIGATNNNQMLGTTIENRGALSVINPNGYFVYFGASNSEPGLLDNHGALTVTNDGDFSYSGYTGMQKIINRGTLNRTGIGTATIRESVTFDNLGGTISVEGGIFEAGGGGTIDGMTIAQGIFDIGNGSFTLPADSTISGPGTFRMKAGIGTGNAEIVAGANAQIVNFDQVAGSLGVVGTLIVSGQFNFAGGTLRGTGKLVVATGASGTIGAASSSQILGLTVENRGTLTVNNPGQYLYFGASVSEPGVLDNYGTLNIGNLNWTINYSGAHAVVNRGTLVRNGTGTVTIPSGVAFQFLGGSMDIRQGTLVFATGSSLAFNGTSYLRGNSGATLLVNGSLTGSTTNAGLFAPLNLVQFSGGSSVDPRTLEVMGNDLGPTAPSFVRNFAYGVIGISGYTRLVDQFDNSPTSTTPEAIYVDTLVVNSGSTLDLNGYKLYARASQVNGTITGGSIVILTDSGPLPLNTPTSGRINQVGEIDEWTVYGRTGRGLLVRLNPGDGSTVPPANPVLSRGGLEIRDPAGAVIATANSASAGQVITAIVETLPADGTYKLRVKASMNQPNATGNYQVAVYDATIRTHSLRLDTPQTATLTSEYTIDRWNFTAVANTQVRLRRINSSSDTIQFALRGPNGFEGFINLTGDSELVTLPTNGAYTLEVIAGGTAGSYAFRLDQTAQATLTLDTPITGTIPGSGTAHLYRLDMADEQLLRVVLRDTRNTDRNDVYVKFGSAPTRSSYDFKNPTPGAAHTLLSPTGQAGTWYILAYNDYAPVPGTFEIEVNAGRVFTTAVSPTKHGTGGDATLQVKGVGFVEGTTVALVNGATTFAGTVIATTSTQLQVRFAAGSVPPGVYSIRVTRPTSEQATLLNAFEFTAGGQPDLRATVTVPSNVRYNAVATLYVEYTNAGTVGMPAPLLYVTATQNGKQAAVLSLDAQQVIPGLNTTTLPAGYKHVIRIFGHGAMPGWLQPGETVRVPIYYSGWLQPWNMSFPAIRFDVQSVTAADTTLVDWTNLLGPLSAEDRTALQGTIANYQANLGSTWGQYVRKLNEYVQATTYPGMIPAADVDGFEHEFLRNAGEAISANRSDLVELANEPANREPVLRDPFEYRKKGGLYHFENGEWSLIRDYNDVNHASNAKTIVIIHGQSNTVYTGWQRAIATELAATEPAGTNILAVDWSDWADATVPTNVFPHTANVARRVARGLFGVGITDQDGFEILGLQLNPENTHLIGHSFGAHISGMIGGYVSGRLAYRGAYLTGIAPYRGMVKRITALDPAEEGVQHSYIVSDGALPQLYVYEPPEPWSSPLDIISPEPHPNPWGLGWGNIYGSKVATYLDSYKSSSFDGGETAWGDENFLLVQDGTHWNQDDRDGDLLHHAAHGYAYQWYASTIRNAGSAGNPYGLGYWWNTQSNYAWPKVAEKLQSPVTTGPWRGLIRGTPTTSKLEGISVAITDPNNSDPKLKYPGTWSANPNPARNGVQALNDGAAVNRVLDDLARVVELRIPTETLTAVSPLPVGSSQPIQFTIADHADVRSLADSDRHEEQNKYNFAYKVYLSTKETVDADAILLNTEGFLPLVNEAQDQRLINAQIALPTKTALQSKYGTDVGSDFFFIIQAANEYSYELYKDNNTKAFPVTLDLEAQAVKIDAGPDQWIEDPIYVGLNGSNSGPLTAIDTSTIRWSSPSNEVFILPTNSLATGASIENARRSGQYEFVLEFKDLEGNSYRDTMIVHVREPNPQPPKDPEGNANTQPIGASDPNQLVGPAGYGPENFVALKALDYRIDFENDPEATAPAQVVTVVNELSSHFDLDTFQIQEVGWGTTRLPFAAKTRQLDMAVSITIGGQTFDVRLQTELDYATRTFTMEFQSIDPLTSLPPDIFTGFLPPEDGEGTGQGFISYSISPKADTPTGTEIRNIASITFDYGETIFTNQVDPHDPTQGTDPAKEALVTIDAEAPVATVSPLWPVTTLTAFPIYWDGEDLVGAGFASYDVYVAEENGPFTLWLSETTATQATFVGVAGKTYQFRVLGRDLIGNLQTLDSATQTKVTIANAPTPVADVFAYKPGKVLTGNVVKNDVNPTKRKLTVILLSSPTAGGVQLQPSGAFRYTPNAGSAARDSFTYKLCDQDGNESGPMTVTLATQLVNFRKTAVKGAEKTGTATLTVDLLTPAVVPTTVTYLVAPQSARGRGQDYTATSGTLTFAAGERTKTLTVTINTDAFDEDTETFQVWLQDITGTAAIGMKPMATVSITDANALPQVSFRTPASTGAEDVSPSIEVFLREPSGRTVTVNYSVLKTSKAKLGADHQLAKGTLTFAPGITSLWLPVPILDDTTDEASEPLIIGLAAPKNAVLKGNKTHTYTVQDNDSPPTVAFTTSTQTISEAAGTVFLTVRLSTPSAFPVTVRYGLDLTGTATSGQDFRAVAGTLKFAAGEVEKTIPLKLTNDTQTEAAETIKVLLYEPTNATLGTLNLLTLSLLDDDT